MNKVLQLILWVLMLPINLIRWLFQGVAWLLMLPLRLIEIIFTLPFWFLGWLSSFLRRSRTAPAEIVRVWQDPPPGATGRHWTYVLFDSRGEKIQVKLHFFQINHFLANYGEGDVGTITHRGKWLAKWEPASTKKSAQGATPAKNDLVFISYSHEWQNDAKFIAEYLGARGVNVWFDEHKLEPGDSLRKEIVQMIDKAAYFIPVLSENYFRSIWCREEFELAANVGTKIIPVKIGQGEIFMPPAIKRLYQDKLGEPLHLDLNKKNPRKRLARLASKILDG